MNNKLKCPITGDELVYIGRDEDCMDGSSYYSPTSDKSIIYSVWPRRNNIYGLVDSMSNYSKESRYFKLNEDNSWTEMKRVPHGDKLFPKNFFGSEWKKACSEAEDRYQKRLERENYWKENPEEDPRYFAKTISADKVIVSPMGAPIGMLFYLDHSIKSNENIK
jgi:hypothetical protein